MNVTAVEVESISEIVAMQRRTAMLVMDFATGAWDVKMTLEELKIMVGVGLITSARCRNG